MHRPAPRLLRSFWLALAVAAGMAPSDAGASDFSQPWLRSDRALVIDAYEYNPIDWQKLSTDKRIAGFINKASDGLPPPYACSGNETETRLCKALWKRHAVARELFHTRKMLAKSLGLKWGAYHLARPGNPVDQANNFIDFAEPGPDDLIALDIEENDPTKWMSLEDAEEFARHIQRRIGRFPVLYTNGTTAQYIADNRDRYPLLSRLPLWYARYKPEIGMHFPKGNWQRYTLWQFASQANCNDRSCPYRVPGTRNDIDVNVASMDAEELRKAWPFSALLDVPTEMIASVPVPVTRQAGLAGDVTLSYAPVEKASAILALAGAFHAGGQQYPGRYGAAPERSPGPIEPSVVSSVVAEADVYPDSDDPSFLQTIAGYLTDFSDRLFAWAGDSPGIDPTTTATVPGKTER
ncbi:glycoside hydrolase family 25 protein [Mesorhizobium sp. ZC-5]|uniref:glycoside hydrolase family 25 protein n=1 Tax=Mesorhizobium sp. ZC-5 TaxID=2986066 RepID=UPI0039913902